MPRAGSSGASMISTRPSPCPTPTTSSASPRAPGWPSNSNTSPPRPPRLRSHSRRLHQRPRSGRQPLRPFRVPSLVARHRHRQAPRPHAVLAKIRGLADGEARPGQSPHAPAQCFTAEKSPLPRRASPGRARQPRPRTLHRARRLVRRQDRPRNQAPRALGMHLGRPPHAEIPISTTPISCGQSARAPDPFLVLHGTWILRRLSPYCSRIELSALPRSRDEEKLLWGMGRELANIHCGARAAVPRILRDLRRPQSQVAAPGHRDHGHGHLARLERMAKAPGVRGKCTVHSSQSARELQVVMNSTPDTPGGGGKRRETRQAEHHR